jgi:hypothetical protein
MFFSKIGHPRKTAESPQVVQKHALKKARGYRIQSHSSFLNTMLTLNSRAIVKIRA